MCDSDAIEARFDLSRKFKYLRKVYELAGLEHSVCKSCGCDFFAPGQIARNNEKLIQFEKTFVKDISPREIYQIREKYLLSQEEAEKVFNSGKNMFSKWERGTSAPTGTAALTLISALEDPAYMKKLADRVGFKLSIETDQRDSNKKEELGANDTAEIQQDIGATVGGDQRDHQSISGLLKYASKHTVTIQRVSNRINSIHEDLLATLSLNLMTFGGHGWSTPTCDDEIVTEKLIKDAHLAQFGMQRAGR